MARRYRCKFCNEWHEDSVKVPAGRFCSMDHAIEYAKKQQEKQREQQLRKAKQSQEKKEKAARAKRRERKDELRPIKWYADRAQREFNRFIRLRDAGIPCISCGKPDNGKHQRHASHYRSRGACSSLRFDESNVHASCSVCNNHLSGNISGYTPSLMGKIGLDEFERIESASKTKQWTKEELINIYSLYKRKYNELKSNL